ncbi:MAG: hypothetical protein PWP23_441 [Candidatus Sumerlaeota bacterium]|nr:hypothetical protein [Candidatus Sumerlaeota bacterium]
MQIVRPASLASAVAAVLVLASPAAAQLNFSEPSPAETAPLAQPAEVPEPAPAVEQWIPRVGETYPALDLVSWRDEPVRLSSMRGKVLLVEYAAMPSPISQAFAGANLRGALGEVRPDTNVLSLGEVLPFFAKGLEYGDKRFAHVTILIAGPDGGAPTAADARAWARHFGIAEEQGRFVVAASGDTLARGVRAFAPGFHLVDTDFRIAEIATSGDVPERLRLNVLPKAPKLLGLDTNEKDDDGALTITLDDLNSLQPVDNTPVNPAVAAEQAARTVDEAAGDVEPGLFIQPVTLRKLDPILTHEQKLVMVYMFSTKSEASQRIWPVAGALAVNNRDKIRSLRLDTSEDEEAIQQYRLAFLPTFIFFKDGKEVRRFGGEFAAADIQQFIDTNAK